MEDISSEYEKKVNQLSSQIVQLQAQIETLKALIDDKEYIISQLNNENSQLKAQINRNQQQASPARPPTQYVDPTLTANTEIFTNKRKCPVCGAMGFAIKEFEDKSRIISYIPRRIYAKKKVCTKCRHEF